MRPLSVSKPGSQRGYFSEWEPDSSRPLGGARSRAASLAGLAGGSGHAPPPKQEVSPNAVRYGTINELRAHGCVQRYTEGTAWVALRFSSLTVFFFT